MFTFRNQIDVHAIIKNTHFSDHDAVEITLKRKFIEEQRVYMCNVSLKHLPFRANKIFVNNDIYPTNVSYFSIKTLQCCINSSFSGTPKLKWLLEMD